MRFGVWAVAGLCAAWVVGPARAQSVSPATIMGGPAPSSIVNKPIDLSSAVAVPGQPGMQSRFNFSALFRRFTIPGFPTTRGVSPLPPPSSFPSTQYQNYKMVGTPPRPIGDPTTANSPIQPVMPVIPSTTTPVGPGSQ